MLVRHARYTVSATLCRHVAAAGIVHVKSGMHPDTIVSTTLKGPFRQAIGIFSRELLQKTYGADWWQKGVYPTLNGTRGKGALRYRGTDDERFARLDTQALLHIMKHRAHWSDIFEPVLDEIGHTYIYELLATRNTVAHEDPVSLADARRALNTMIRLLHRIGAEERFIQDIQQEARRLDFVTSPPVGLSVGSFPQLTAGLVGIPDSLHIHLDHFLHEYLSTPDVPVPFGGRRDQIAALNDWLEDDRTPYALLIAGAGQGKSALLTRWADQISRAQRALVAFVPISIRFNTARKSATLHLLGARLRFLHATERDPVRDLQLMQVEIEQYLQTDRPAGAPPLLVILDGVDEATDWEPGRDMAFPRSLGQGVKLLMSGRTLANRNAIGWRERLGLPESTHLRTLPPLDRNGVADVLLQTDPTLRADDALVDELCRLSAGDPLLMRLYVEALGRGGSAPAFLTRQTLPNIQPGLQAYFAQWWQSQEEQWRIQHRDPIAERTGVLEFLNVCAMALGPLTHEDSAALLGASFASGLRLQRMTDSVGRFLLGDGKDKPYVFSHPRLAEFFREQMLPQERLTYQERFLTYGQHIYTHLVAGTLAPAATPVYVVRYYRTHLERADVDVSHHIAALICPEWLRAWEAVEGTYDGFLNDLACAWNRADQDGADPNERSQIVGLQIRYALIRASIQSMSSNLSPDLLEGLVANKLWTPLQGLAYAHRIPGIREQIWALRNLAPFLQEPEMCQALKACADQFYLTGDLLKLLLTHEIWTPREGLKGGGNRNMVSTIFPASGLANLHQIWQTHGTMCVSD